MLARVCYGLTIVALSCGAALGQQINDIVTATQPVQVYTVPPSGFPIALGSPLFFAQPGQQFKIVDVRPYKAFIYTDIWVNIIASGGFNSGWAYWGRQGSQSANFGR